ncbi:YebC [Legionella geestiana]|uniref:Probable transcriptional regulatory protein Lgee_1008 n=1 Tax=Legionella geestiana TaxID=45065 RepID=A0A0W0TYH0_9GAMM|nr:YebC/PmpR family DNA-binding transcriptional regulator [Legionella geestiana]KTD00744.1 YebC [Legionella geestiana]QBS11600.1 YebC/PmpR family DNA-binding transcriptional regulator [Legionella geestiana]QDQ40791.1 YebC/PmpR family DNA-binding transcriptional regulator [Legionella geestiana]STX53721.1 YebC [Legionella geestiana]
MAGHSKWANIKFRKGVQDAKRGKIFTKLIREITVSARTGGEESGNPRLRDAVTKALKANMKRDTIDNAIKRGLGGLDGASMMEMRYEGYGPGGIAILVDCLSDNKNRTVSDVRHAFTKYGGNLGTDGSVAYLFTKQGEILLAEGVAEDRVMEVAIEAGADDVNVDDEGYLEVITAPELFHLVLSALQESGLAVEQAQIAMRAENMIPVSGDAAESLMKLIDALEDLDDVQDVYSNAEFSQADMDA